jgi:hypothetical protein
MQAHCSGHLFYTTVALSPSESTLFVSPFPLREEATLKIDTFFKKRRRSGLKIVTYIMNTDTEKDFSFLYAYFYQKWQKLF